jgi:transketolase
LALRGLHYSLLDHPRLVQQLVGLERRTLDHKLSSKSRRMGAWAKRGFLASGSEVALCVEAYESLTAEGIKARVVSMPSWEMFEHYCRDHPEYCEQVLPSSVTARVSVEKGSTLGWAQYVGRRGHSIGMKTFGASAPLKELQKKFGFTTENIIAAAKQQIAALR